MLIGKDTVVGVNYALDVDGMQLDASGDTPLTYLHGHGMMIPGFEKQPTVSGEKIHHGRLAAWPCVHPKVFGTPIANAHLRKKWLVQCF